MTPILAWKFTEGSGHISQSRMRVAAGLDTEAVARLLRRSPAAVRVAAHGMRRLADMLTEAGVTL